MRQLWKAMRPRCTHLHADNDSVQVQNGLPVFAQNVQANISFQIDIWMVDLLQAFHFRGIVREVLVDGEREVEGAIFVHALVGLDGQGEIEDVVGVGEGHFHRISQSELLKI